jgi:CysZ protein
MWKSLGLTTAILVLAGIGLDRLALSLVHVGPAWLSAVLSIVVAVGVVAGMIFLAPPTASLVASFFLDDIAALVERTIDPYGPPGRPLPIAPSAAMGLRFAVLPVVDLLTPLFATALMTRVYKRVS